MPSKNGPSVRLWLLKLAILTLSLAVFNWGLQYKMSLYQEASGTAHASVAKLWTGSKTDAQVNPASVTVPATVLPLFLLFLTQPLLVLLNYSAPVTTAWKFHLAEFCRAYLFRPPPVLS